MMDKRNLGDSMMFIWPWWKAKEAGGGKHTGAKTTSPRNFSLLPLLPLEVVDRILSEACEWPLSGAERQMLTACALVCKSWLPLARRLLYHSLIVKSSRSAYTSQSHGPFVSEELLQQSHLLGFTRSLSIHVLARSIATLPLLSGDDVPDRSQECVRIPDFFFLLAHTPRLRYLELSVDWAQKINGPFKHHILNWLSRLALPIEALDLNDGGLFHPTFVYDLVDVWSTIRALRVLTRHSGVPPKRPGISLRELRLPISYLATIVWLLPPPPPNQQSNLRFLELYYIPEEALAVLSVHGPSVSTLTLHRQPAFEIAHLFTKLEELVISGDFWSSPLPAFPKTLKHIRLHWCFPAFMSNHAVAAFVLLLPGLPDLRIISIEEGLTFDEHYSDLQDACKAHRVEILVNSAGRTMHPYHMEMDRFPRQYTFSEFFDAEDRKL